MSNFNKMGNSNKVNMLNDIDNNLFYIKNYNCGYGYVKKIIEKRTNNKIIIRGSDEFSVVMRKSFQVNDITNYVNRVVYDKNIKIDEEILETRKNNFFSLLYRNSKIPKISCESNYSYHINGNIKLDELRNRNSFFEIYPILIIFDYDRTTLKWGLRKLK